MSYVEKILFLLKKNNNISDLQISQILNITQEDVLFYINQICCLGIDIIDYGSYKTFSPIILLDLNLIQQGFTEETFRHINKIELFNSIDSTNDYLKKNSTNVTIAISEEQAAGRGRLGRKWISPFGCNIYLSLVWGKWSNLNEIEGLSVVVGLSAIKTLKNFSSKKLTLKWPNDILWGNKKIAGILIDIISKGQYSYAIIGIGINVNATPNLPNISCLKDMEKTYFNRNIIINVLLKDIFFYLNNYQKHGIKYFIREWDYYDNLCDQNIEVWYNGKITSGKAGGI